MNDMKIGICNDHRGVYMKNVLVEYLEHSGYEVVNYGSDDEASVDFPEYAFKLGDAIAKKRVTMGIAICGTGIGMSIALNKVRGVYCAKISNISEAVLCRQHNNANAIAFSADVSCDLAREMVDKFIETRPLSDSKYTRRNKMIKDRERNA